MPSIRAGSITDPDSTAATAISAKGTARGGAGDKESVLARPHFRGRSFSEKSAGAGGTAGEHRGVYSGVPDAVFLEAQADRRDR